MKEQLGKGILSTTKPEDIFSMNPDTLENELEEYITRFGLEACHTITSFLVKQKLIVLYLQALEKIGSGKYKALRASLTLTSNSGSQFHFDAVRTTNFRLGQMHETSEYVIYVVETKYKSYYENYISKTQFYSKPSKELWNSVQYMVPNVTNHFEDENGRFVIIIKKPCKMYSLREILGHFGGELQPEHVASILTRLYTFVCYTNIVGISHNSITVDDLFFSPGNFVPPGQSYTVEDIRIVGVLGGWFFSTYPDEPIKGMPREILEILPKESRTSGFATYKVDELSIRRVARELFGDSNGNSFENVPTPFVRWITGNVFSSNANEEFHEWERVRESSFGKARFVPMDISI